MSKKVIVTGGAGFIGSHTVVELCAAGYEPIIVDNFSNSEKEVLDRLKTLTGSSVKCHEVDCNDTVALQQVFDEEGDIHGVIHFAAFKAVGESVANPMKYYHNNVGSMVSLLDVMKKSDTQNLVFSSSCTVYGQPEKIPVTEESPTLPAFSPYGNTKQICEDILNDCTVAKEDLNTVILRYFNPIGAHPSGLIGELPLGTPNNLVPLITQTAAGLREKVTVFGNDYNTPDGTCIRDFIHVVDLAKAHVNSLQWMEQQNQGNYCEVFNIGTGKGNSVTELIQTFVEVSQTTLNYDTGERRSGDVEQIYAEVDKAKNVLNWTAEYTLEDALRDAWKWQNNLKHS
jgi:UDP-glucose 4-epimerase